MNGDPFAWRETSPRRPGNRLVVLGLMLALAAVALGAKLAGLEPFSHTAAASLPGAVATPTTAGTAPQPSQPLTPVTAPTGQWIATGRILASFGVANAPAGEVEVQAWSFKHVCGKYLCNIDLTREPSNGSNPAKMFDSPASVAGGFPPYETACVEGGSNRVVPHQHGSERDSFFLNWADHQHELTGQENGSITGCGQQMGNITTNWTATKVPQLQVPVIPISPGHAVSASAFVAAATQVCTRVNADIEPLVATIESDQQTIEARRGVLVAEAETSLAETLPKLVPLAVRIYSEIPQPPEPLNVLWIRAVQIERNVLGPTINYMAATAREMNSLSQYVLTENHVDALDAAAESEIANEDASSIPSADTLIGPIELQLNLPSICTNLPAYSAAVKAAET